MRRWRVAARELAHASASERLTEGIDDPPSSALLRPPSRLGSAPVDLRRRPLELLWPLHQLTQPLAGQAHLSVPLAGGPPRADAAARMGRHLQQLWVQNPLTMRNRITSVALTIVHDRAPAAPAPHRLILMLTFDVEAGSDGFDAPHMAQHLESALRALA